MIPPIVPNSHECCPDESSQTQTYATYADISSDMTRKTQPRTPGHI